MENKSILEGQIISDPKLTEFGSTLFRIQNKRSFKKKDGTDQELTYTGVISAKGATAKIVTDRFKRGDFVRVEGNLAKQKTKKLDQEGNEIWETWINAFKVDAMVYQQNLAPIPEKLQTTPATQQQKQAYQAAKQPTPVFKKPLPQPYQSNITKPAEIEFNEEDPFGDRLPF